MTNLTNRFVGYLSGILFILLCTSASYYTVQTVPNARSEQGDQYVTDPQNILTQEAIDRMNTLLGELEEKKTIETAVVVLPSIREEDPDDFATDLFNYWGIGRPEDNNGLLVLLLTAPEERCIIFRTGTGLQKYLTDKKCYRIQQDDMIPYMAEGDYSTGLVKGIESVVKQIEASKYKPAVSPGTRTSPGSEPVVKKGHPYLGVDLGITAIILFIFLIYWMSNIAYQCPACKKKKLRFISSRKEREATYTTTGLKISLYRCDNCGHERRDEAVIPIRRVTSSSTRRYSTPHRTTVIHTSRPSSTRTSSSGSWSGSSRSTSSSSRSSYSGGRTSGSGSSSSWSSSRSSGGGSRSSFGSSSSRSSSSSSGRSYSGGRSSGGGSRSSSGGSRSKF